MDDIELLYLKFLVPARDLIDLYSPKKYHQNEQYQHGSYDFRDRFIIFKKPNNITYTNHEKNIYAILIIIKECFRPSYAFSPIILPTMIPEKKPWITVACMNNK